MNAHEWWLPVLKHAAWIVAMMLVMGWIARSRIKGQKDLDGGALKPPKSMPIIGGVLFLLFSGMAVHSNVYRAATWGTTAVLLGIAAMSLLLVLEYIVDRHRVSESGMDYRRLSGRRRDLRWADLRSVRYSPFMRWFRLETAGGEVARISAMLAGLPEFAHLLLRHAPAESIDEETMVILRATAAGNPPDVW
jgi:hypothetical protein